MPITVPSTLEGSPLSSKQRERLQDIVDSIEKVNPGRAKDSIVLQAIGSFKKTASVVRGQWVDKDRFFLANGTGPVVIPSWSKLLDV